MNDMRTVGPAARLRGTVEAPPDKSISHRAAMFAALSEHEAVITGSSVAADPESTLDCLVRLGVEVTREPEPGGRSQTVRLKGLGREGLRDVARRSATGGPIELDCGNSGTTMRLMAGILGGAGIHARLVGDASLSGRPMDRILTPLARLGVDSEARDGRFAPVVMLPRGDGGADASQPMRFDLAIASAQLKSALLLAGLFSKEGVMVREPSPSRDHTERMLDLGSPDREGWIRSSLATPVPDPSIRIPGDVSAAAFWCVAGLIHPDAEMVIRSCGLNPTRSGVLEVLQEMGGDLTVDPDDPSAREPLGSIRVRSGRTLRPVHVRGARIPNVIDELPILMVAMCFADGRSEISDARELRVKETDRIAAMADLLRAAGASLQEKEDGIIIDGSSSFVPRLRHATSHHDHRIAMSAAILGACNDAPFELEHSGATAISYPGFWEDREILSR